MRCLNPLRSIKLELDILQDSKNEKSERKTTKSERMIEIIKLRHTEYTLDRSEWDKEGLAIHGRSEGNVSYYQVHVGIKNLYKVGVIGPLKIKQGIPPSLTDDGWERSILECMKVDKTLDLNMAVMERGIKFITSFLILETLHPEGI